MQPSLDEPVVLFHVPPRMARGRRGLVWSRPCGQPDGCGAVVVSADGVLDETNRDGLPDDIGLLPPGRLAGFDAGGAVSVVARDEVADEVTEMGPQAADEMQAQL